MLNVSWLLLGVFKLISLTARSPAVPRHSTVRSVPIGVSSVMATKNVPASVSLHATWTGLSVTDLAVVSDTSVQVTPRSPLYQTGELLPPAALTAPPEI